MKVTMRIEGGQSLQRNLDSLSQRISKKIQRETLVFSAEPMRVRMSDMAPYEPGKPDLRDAMTISPMRPSAEFGEVAVAVGPARHAFYGLFQEMGTAHHAAQPFARPAFDETVVKTLQTIKDDLWVSLVGRGFTAPSTTAAGPIAAGPGGAGSRVQKGRGRGTSTAPISGGQGLL